MDKTKFKDVTDSLDFDQIIALSGLNTFDTKTVLKVLVEVIEEEPVDEQGRVTFDKQGLIALVALAESQIS
jgi:ATPase subunit of ABC transporter with duplicated ATPase domains